MAKNVSTSGSSAWFGEGDRISYKYTINGYRLSNSTMRYTLHLTPHLLYDATWYGTGYVFNVTFSIGGKSKRVNIKSSSSVWSGKNPTGEKTITVDCPSNSTSSVKYSIKWDMTGSDYSENMADSYKNGSIAASDLLYTNCTAPTSVKISRKDSSSQYTSLRGIPGATYTISWSGAKGGTSNPISGYKVVIKRDGKTYQTINVSKSPYDFTLPKSPNSEYRGSTFTFYITAKSTHNEATSKVYASCKVNRLPQAPTVSPIEKYIKSTVTTGRISIKPGYDSDGDTCTVYHDDNSVVTSETNFTAHLHSVRTYDGFEYSEKTYFRINLNKKAGFGLTFTPTFEHIENRSEYSLVRQLKNLTFSAYKENNTSNLIAKLYVKYGETKTEISSMDISNISNEVGAPKTFTFTNISDFSTFLKPGQQFTLFIQIIDNLGELVEKDLTTIYYYPQEPNGDKLTILDQVASEKGKITQVAPENALMFNAAISMQTSKFIPTSTQLSSTTYWYFESLTQDSNKKSKEFTIIPDSTTTITLSNYYYGRAIGFDEKFQIHRVVVDSFGQRKDTIYGKTIQRVMRPTINTAGAPKVTFTGLDYHYFKNKPTTLITISAPSYQVFNGAKYTVNLVDSSNSKTYSLFTESTSSSTGPTKQLSIGASYFDSIISKNFSPTSPNASNHRVSFRIRAIDSFGNSSNEYTPLRNGTDIFNIILLESPVFKSKNTSINLYFNGTKPMPLGTKKIVGNEFIKVVIPAASDYNNRAIRYEVDFRIGGKTYSTATYDTSGEKMIKAPNNYNDGLVSLFFRAINATGNDSFIKETDVTYCRVGLPTITILPGQNINEDTKTITAKFTINDYGVSAEILKRDGRTKGEGGAINCTLRAYVNGQWYNRVTIIYSADEITGLPKSGTISYKYTTLPTENFPIQLRLNVNIGYSGSTSAPLTSIEGFSANNTVTVTSPTFSIRKHVVAINAASEINQVNSRGKQDSVLIVKNNGEQRLVRFVGIDMSGGELKDSLIEFDLLTGTVTHGIIDGGTASQFS